MKAFKRFGFLAFAASVAPAILPAAVTGDSDDPAKSARTPRRPDVARQIAVPAHGTTPLPTGESVAATGLPPLPAGVEQLDFKDFFKTPVGPRGLEITSRLQSLDGRRVRILGYMVKEDLHACNSCVPDGKGRDPESMARHATVPGRILITPNRCTVAKWHFGLADDLPPQTVFVTIPELAGKIVRYEPEPLLMTGTLRLGSRPEEDGRISIVRLMLDSAAPFEALHAACGSHSADIEKNTAHEKHPHTHP